ncbi:MAG: Hsp20/alpha crystallin family protein [Thiobacillaceae bacterium]
MKSLPASVPWRAEVSPAINVGNTARCIEIYAFEPGIDPSAIDVQLEKGVLTIAAERNTADVPEKATVQINERFKGCVRRVLALPDDVDPNSIEAKYREGVLHIHFARKEDAQPRRITVQ